MSRAACALSSLWAMVAHLEVQVANPHGGTQGGSCERFGGKPTRSQAVDCLTPPRKSYRFVPAQQQAIVTSTTCFSKLAKHAFMQLMANKMAEKDTKEEIMKVGDQSQTLIQN